MTINAKHQFPLLIEAENVSAPEPLGRFSLAPRPPRTDVSDAFPYDERLSRRTYETRLTKLQLELAKLQLWLRDSRERLVILFEGRDAAGKGGVIKRFTEHLNPRHCRVVCLDIPTEIERGQWYFQRYIEQLPTAGEIVLFDRSWYNRAGVERVMSFCSETEYVSFFPQANDLEHNLIGSGMHLVKLWFDVSRHEQMRRMWQRSSDPLKRWKLSPVDLHALDRWQDYCQAEEVLFSRTATPWSPWVRIKSDCKRRARLEAIRHVLSRFEYANKNHAAIGDADDLLTSVLSSST